MQEIMIQYAPIILVVIWVLIQSKIFITPKQVDDKLKDYATRKELNEKHDVQSEKLNVIEGKLDKFMEELINIKISIAELSTEIKIKNNG